MILLTGATGFLGMEVLARLAGEEVVLPIRGDDPAGRLDDVCDLLGVRGARWRAVPGDLEAGPLDPALARGLTRVVHCAASVSFTLPLEEARRINVAGTERVLELAAAAPGLEHLVHVSTAYVAGDRTGRLLEDEGDVGQAFRNTYERTKLEAEGAVRAAGLPVSVIRPSIVVGDSRTGWTPAFNVIYWPIQAFARGLLPEVPGDPDALADVVPVDTVADTIVQVAGGPPVGTVHVCTGDRAIRAGELASRTAAWFGKPQPRFVDDPEAAEATGAFAPYFTVRGVFDTARAEALGVVAPRLEDYLPRLLEHAVAARWGRRRISRPEYVMA
jgi:long-chain acyl-CoA synthetase